MILESACPEIESDGWHSAPGFGAYMFGTLSSILEMLRDKHSSVFFFIIIIKNYYYYYYYRKKLVIFFFCHKKTKKKLKYIISFSILAVPETASGLQGEQPLVHGVK